ncbi:hypothetical protein N3K66_004604 [Trichothecium roseum]|uniref:Uncharacterized protein n=1 Tax=Trichothecium roseum TaxID=47278 RepID=A0ACC0V291_9HYPO|nr:hypothetical protein N3K66_004604 [Trichothecium roseum]
MPFTTRRRAAHRRPVTTTTKAPPPRRSIFSSRRTHRTKRAPRPYATPMTHTHGTHHHTTAAPVHHQRRRPSMKDKVSGALLKLKGTLTHRPAVKAAGTRRMHGTDGRGSRRVRRW